MRNEDTIVAIATPPGAGGVGIVRLSGNRAVPIAKAMFRLSRAGPHEGLDGVESHRLVHGWIESEGRTVDEALAVVMRAPRSYTREDVVELHCHGGPLVLRTVVELALHAGARLAEPGEFTFRAFVNGRIDLTRAEAVGDIVRSESRLALEAGANQLRGRLYGEIKALTDTVARVAALVAAGIDFPEEDGVFAQREEITGRLEEVRERLEGLLAGAGRGRRVREGVAVAIAGRPNVGKSSLLNLLLRENRAIVTEVPGTTRDTVEEVLDMAGLTVRLVDTAGIRASKDPVELQGIARAREAMAKAELVLLVLDGAAPLTAEDESLLAGAAPEASLVVVNKVDLLPAGGPEWLERLEGRETRLLSATTGQGLSALEDWIAQWALEGERPGWENAMITNLRQEQAAKNAQLALAGALEAIERNLGDELLAVDLDRILLALGDVVGETTADDLLNRIFAEFCIGK